MVVCADGEPGSRFVGEGHEARDGHRRTPHDGHRDGPPAHHCSPSAELSCNRAVGHLDATAAAPVPDPGRLGKTAPVRLPVMPPLGPMLAKSATDLPVGEGWLFEPKWDGFRCIVFRDGDEVELGSRNERPLTRYFPELPAGAAGRPARALRRRRRARRAGSGRPGLRRAPAAHPPSGVAGEPAGGRDAHPLPGLRPPRLGRRGSAGGPPGRPAGPAGRGAAAAAARAPQPVHDRPRRRAAVVRAVRGGRARRHRGQAPGRHLSPRRADDGEGEAQPDGRLRGGGLPLAQGRPRDRVAAARPLRRRR